MRISNTALPATGSPLLGGDRTSRPALENAKLNIVSAPGGAMQFAQQTGLQTLAARPNDVQSPNLLGLVMKRLLGGDERTTSCRPLADTR